MDVAVAELADQALFDDLLVGSLVVCDVQGGLLGNRCALASKGDRS